MKSFGIFLLLLGFTMARADPVPAKVNQLVTKKSEQVTKPTVLETSSTQNQNLQISSSQHLANEMRNPHNQDQHSHVQNLQFHNQDQSGKFYSQAFEFHNQELNQQLHDQGTPIELRNQNHPRHFNSQDQAQQFPVHNQVQQVYNGDQGFYSQENSQQYSNQINVRSSEHQQDEMSRLFQTQQQMIKDVSTAQPQLKEQAHDISAQQHFYSERALFQPDFQQNVRNIGHGQDHESENRFDDVTNQPNNLFRGLQSTEMDASAHPQTYKQISAFERGFRPIILPGVGRAHSTSVVVSGLKNLPSLPAMVYSAGAVPSKSQVFVHTRPWHQGGAYIRQHWQTPYARYVFSHIL